MKQLHVFKVYTWFDTHTPSEAVTPAERQLTPWPRVVISFFCVMTAPGLFS